MGKSSSGPKVKETLDTLGKVLPQNHTQGRDAVHIAVMPVVAGEEGLRPGEKLRIKFGTDDVVVSGDYNENDYLGIVDPFIQSYGLKKGEKFWMWLRPGTITGLRHEWTHAKIDAPKPQANDSELWLRNFADEWNFDYDEMVKNAQYDDGYITARGRDLHGRSELGGDETLFWYHMEKLTGKKFGDDHRENFGWSCSC